MKTRKTDDHTLHFLKSLGFPELMIHNPHSHFDFRLPGRRILVIGPMGSGKTEFSARVWRDSRIALMKSEIIAAQTTTKGADRRNVFYIRSVLDRGRFPDYPEDALAYRGGYESCGGHICSITDSFELERLLNEHRETGTWIIDEASFYDERMAYVIQEASEQRGLTFLFPTLILNFRKIIFNPTARFILDTATDIIPLTAYCEHDECLEDSFYTYRYYMVDGTECPALYFDPLIIIGGDRKKEDPLQPNYCTRCDRHHYLPGREYTYLILKPMGEQASRGNTAPLREELFLLKNNIEESLLKQQLEKQYIKGRHPEPVNLNALRVPCIAEKALMFLFAEQNLISEAQLRDLADQLDLNRKYLQETLGNNRRPVELDQPTLSFCGEETETADSSSGG
jgi:thymidine kinase